MINNCQFNKFMQGSTISTLIPDVPGATTKQTKPPCKALAAGAVEWPVAWPNLHLGH
jgi:hypothetical protein